MSDLTGTWLAKLEKKGIFQTRGVWMEQTAAPGGPKRNRQSKADAQLTARPVDLDGLIWLDKCVGALLAHAVLSAERHPVSDWEGLAEGNEREKKKRSED